MRRSLILLLVLAVLSVGVIGVAVPYVNKDAESVTYTEQRRYGDPAAGEGLQIESLLTYDGKLHWDNTITLGATVETQSVFHFTAAYTTEREVSEDTLNLFCQSNMGMSSNGAIEFTEDREIAWLAEVLTVAAEQTPNGAEDYPVTVPLAPYLDYYEIALEGSGIPWYWDDVPQFWETVTEFFHVPVGENDVAEITISKDAEGNVYSLNYNLPDVEDIYGSGIQGPDGCWYVLFTARDRDGNPIAGTATQGIYRIPVAEVTYGQETVQQVQESGVELVYATEGYGNLYSMEDGTRMLLVGSAPYSEQSTLFDWASMEPLQTFPTGGHYTGNEGGWYSTQVENDHVVTVSTQSVEGGEPSQWITVWALGDNGLYEKVVDCDTTAGMEENSAYSSSFFDGERFLRVSYVEHYWDTSINVQLCDSQGLQYAALLIPNVREQEYSPYWIQTETGRPTPGLAQSIKNVDAA